MVTDNGQLGTIAICQLSYSADLSNEVYNEVDANMADNNKFWSEKLTWAFSTGEPMIVHLLIMVVPGGCAVLGDYQRESPGNWVAP